MATATSSDHKPLEPIREGIAAGLIGTACMTALQELALRAKRRVLVDVTDDHGSSNDDPWKRAPAPAQLLKLAVEKATGVEPDPVAIPLYTNVMHWGYGTALGVAYALAAPRLRLRAGLAGPAFGLSVWAQSYATLVPLGLYKWPWHYSARTLAKDVSYHLVYGTGTALGYRLVTKGRR